MTQGNPVHTKMKAEWSPQKRVWLAWPADGTLWQEDLAPAQHSVAEFAKAILSGGAGVAMLCANEAAQQEAKNQLEAGSRNVTFHRVPYGDIWLRDTGPIFVHDEKDTVYGATFRFNGWGGKYVLAGDTAVAKEVAKLANVEALEEDWVCEGGALEIDGEGTGLTTEQCLLNTNRNPGLAKRAIEIRLRERFGIEQLVWLEKGLLFDHTDGHIDNLARFIAPGVVLCMEALRRDDPQRDILAQALKRLKKARAASGRRLEIITIPSPGIVTEPGSSDVLPASYLNFLITNQAVIVPLFRSDMDEQAYYRFTHLFPGKKIIGIECPELLTGGGSLHCISQQEPM